MSLYIRKRDRYGTCSGLKRNGKPCSNTARPNGKCERHGGDEWPESGHGHGCARCGSCYSEIHQHHVVQRQDGGRDDIDNLVDLCVNCHEEFHRLVDGTVPFWSWLETPTPRLLWIAAVLRREEVGGLTVNELVDLLKGTRHRNRNDDGMRQITLNIWTSNEPS